MSLMTAIAEDALYEVIDGRVVEKPPMGMRQTWILATLIRLLVRSDEVNERGAVFPEPLFHLDPARPRKRRPDLAFVSYERWPKGRPIPDEEAWEMVPDLAAEVVSKSNSADEVVGKIEDYFRAGVRLVWVIYPSVSRVYVYTSASENRILGPGDELDGGAVIPGFRVPVAALFGTED